MIRYSLLTSPKIVEQYHIVDLVVLQDRVFLDNEALLEVPYRYLRLLKQLKQLLRGYTPWLRFVDFSQLLLQIELSNFDEFRQLLNVGNQLVLWVDRVENVQTRVEPEVLIELVLLVDLTAQKVETYYLWEVRVQKFLQQVLLLIIHIDLIISQHLAEAADRNLPLLFVEFVDLCVCIEQLMEGLALAFENRADISQKTLQYLLFLWENKTCGEYFGR